MGAKGVQGHRQRVSGCQKLAAQNSNSPASSPPLRGNKTRCAHRLGCRPPRLCTVPTAPRWNCHWHVSQELARPYLKPSAEHIPRERAAQAGQTPPGWSACGAASSLRAGARPTQEGEVKPKDSSPEAKAMGSLQTSPKPMQEGEVRPKGSSHEAGAAASLQAWPQQTREGEAKPEGSPSVAAATMPRVQVRQSWTTAQAKAA